MRSYSWCINSGKRAATASITLIVQCVAVCQTAEPISWSINRSMGTLNIPYTQPCSKILFWNTYFKEPPYLLANVICIVSFQWSSMVRTLPRHCSKSGLPRPCRISTRSSIMTPVKVSRSNAGDWTNRFEKYANVESNWTISPNRSENKVYIWNHHLMLMLQNSEAFTT